MSDIQAKSGPQQGEDCVVLLLNHQPLFLEALASVVATIPRTRVLREVLDGHDFDSLQTIDPHVVIIDPCAGGTYSATWIESVKKVWPLSRLMVLSDCNEPDAVGSALAYGAHAFVLKSEPIETIRAAIEFLCRGGAPFSLPAAALMAAKVAAPKVVPSLSAPVERGLTPREVQVLHLVARGHTDPEIGRMIGISPRTTQRHITNILNKLNCRNRSQAVAQMIGLEPPLAMVRPSMMAGGSGNESPLERDAGGTSRQPSP